MKAYEDFKNEIFASGQPEGSIPAEDACWALYCAEQVLDSIDQAQDDELMKVDPTVDDDIHISLNSLASRLREALGIKSDYGDTDGSGFVPDP